MRPETVRALAGIRGAAVAITRLPEGDGPPGGVAVLHAGELAALRGLLEAGVLAGGCPPIRSRACRPGRSRNGSMLPSPRAW